MKFRTQQILITVGMIVAVVAATVIAAQILLTRSSRAEVEASIARAHEVFDDAYSRAAALHAVQAEVVANEPRLKAVVATGDVDRATILDVCEELQEAVGSQIFLLLDGDGQLIADTQAPDVEGVDLSDRPVVATALAEGRASAAWADEAGLYQVSARRLEFGRDVVGVLLLGHRLDDSFLAATSIPTRAAVALSVDGTPASSSVAEGELTPELAAALAALAEQPDPSDLGQPGRWLATSRTVAAYEGGRSVTFVAGRSLDAAMAESRALRQTLWAIGLVAIAAGMLVAFSIATRLARPLEHMAALARRFGEGDLDARVELAGPSEAITLGKALHEMAAHLGQAQRELLAKQRLEREMEIAERIQTSILPTITFAAGLSFAHHMQTATEVGGDYFDIVPLEEGCWLAIGDVAGHGLEAGLVMMMVQSAISVATRHDTRSTPAELLTRVNETLYHNVRERLGQDEHVTLTLLRYHPDGRIVHAGAHEDLLVFRAATGEVEAIRTDGTWIGIVPDIADMTPLQEFRLELGDVLLLYSDGITEARDEAGVWFGIERVRATLKARGPDGPAAVVDALVREVADHVTRIDDDVTLLAIARS